MLRKKLLLAINDALSRPPFIYVEDFRIRVTDRERDKTTGVQIDYLCDEGQFLIAYIPHQKTSRDDFSIAVKTKPGELTDTQNDTVEGERGLIGHIQAWTIRIHEDITSAPEFRAAEAMSQRVSDIEARLDEIPDELATPEQVKQLHELLIELEKSLRSQIESLGLSVQEKKDKINELQKQFDALHKRADSSKVRTMLRTIVSRVYRFAADPDLPKLIENGKRIAGMLGGPESHG